MKQAGKILLITLFALGWFELAAQFYLIIVNRTTSITETVIRYFSFFTILTNLLVTLCITNLLISKNRNRFFTRPMTITAIAVYITIVGLVYNIILRSLWQPEGLQLLVDELLHSVIPALFIIYWVVWIPKANIHIKNVLSWLIYPLVYLVFILTRGTVSSYYPYPFVDVTVLGYGRVFINSAGMLLAFLVVSILFFGINKQKKGESS